MSARRSLLTTAAAGALLGALCFVPSANATSPTTHEAPRNENATSQHTTASGTTSETASGTTTEASDRLAETGGFDTTPYVVGGTAFLSLGAGFVAFSARRERTSGGKVSY
ncbi:LAETG motif-containing sortase-dependent surface protein [Streptomyces venezuelae]|uniref:LAETG motif-containing sortase-dependent surface protein n=1 Tax=Streptomyces venezuelae TaxID=54571 RepID=UPI0037AD768A